jgi:hypothetical protein
LKKNFWWTRMKQEIAKYVSECDTCRRVKADHLRPTKNLQPLSIPKWKWENICMDFIMGLSRTSHGYNSTWLIVDRLSYIYRTSSVIMAYRRPLFLTDDLSLLLTFGSNCMSVWAPILSSEAQPITPRLMGRLNESIKLLRICSMIVFKLMVRKGASTFH